MVASGRMLANQTATNTGISYVDGAVTPTTTHTAHGGRHMAACRNAGHTHLHRQPPDLVNDTSVRHNSHSLARVGRNDVVQAARHTVEPATHMYSISRSSGICSGGAGICGLFDGGGGESSVRHDAVATPAIASTTGRHTSIMIVIFSSGNCTLPPSTSPQSTLTPPRSPPAGIHTSH